MKKWVYFLIAVLMLTALAGCGKNKKSSSDSVSSDSAKEFVFDFTALDDKLGDVEMGQACLSKDRILISAYRYEETQQSQTGEGEEIQQPQAREAAEVMIVEEATEDKESTGDKEAAEDTETEAISKTTVSNGAFAEAVVADNTYLEDEMVYSQDAFFKMIQMDLSGTQLAEFEIKLPTEGGINAFCADDDGNVYTVLDEYGKDTSNPDMYKDLFTLVVYTQSGEELYRVALGGQAGPDEYYYVNKILYAEDGTIIIGSTSGLEIYNKDGSFKKNIKTEEETSDIYLLRDGKIAYLKYEEQGMCIRTLDTETEQLSDKISLPFNAYNYSFYTGQSSDFLLVDSSGVYTYNLGDAVLNKVFDFVDSDLLCTNLYSLAEVKENQLFGCYYDNVEEKTKFGLFNKVDPADVKDKTVLTLACSWIDWDVRNQVVKFNKNNSEYRIRIEDYSQYNTMDDYTVGMTKMNTDIASGNIPDIVMLNSDMPIDSYISKGLFADLNQFMENDPELKKENYMENIIDIYSRDGKWYQLVPSYYLGTVFGKTADVGEEPGWTMEDLQALRKKKGEDVAVFSEMTRSGMLYYSMNSCAGQFINWETGECTFNSQEFIEWLEFIKEFPEEINYDELYNDEEYWKEQETLFRDGKALLMPYTLSNFDDFLYCEDGTFGEQITAIGFPVNEGVGNVITCNWDFAISAKSANQQTAWDFLRYYLTEEYQDSIEYGWPVLKSSLDKRVQKAMQKPFYLDEEGNKVEYDNTYFLNGVEITMEPLTKEDCDRVIGYLKGANRTSFYNGEILKIMEEETAAYFNGQKSAKEVADIIQSRVQIYVNESR